MTSCHPTTSRKLGGRCFWLPTSFCFFISLFLPRPVIGIVPGLVRQLQQQQLRRGNTFSKNQDTSDDTWCAIEGATYGYASSSQQQTNVHWADIVGLACANHHHHHPNNNNNNDNNDNAQNLCYAQASAWSSVARKHGNKPVTSAVECHALCQETPECQVWNFWPQGFGVVASAQATSCDICPQHATLLRAQVYCFEEECGICGDVYDFFAENGLPKDEDYTCDDMRSIFEMVGCCVYDDEEKKREESTNPGTCELLSSVTTATSTTGTTNNNNKHVLNFHSAKTVTGPRDCQHTKWLPFLETTENPNQATEHDDDEEEVKIDLEADGYCNPCPSAYGLVLNRERTYVDENGNINTCGDAYDYITAGNLPDNPCKDLADWMRYSSKCCDWSAVEGDSEIPYCDPCPQEDGYVLHREVIYEDQDAEDGFRTCGYAYDLVLAGGVKDVSCENIQNWMLDVSFCCSPPLPNNTTQKSNIDFEVDGYCNPCPSAYGLVLDHERTYVDENGIHTCGDAYDYITAGNLPDNPCEDLADWMRYTSNCCDWSAVEGDSEIPYCDPCASVDGYVLHREVEYKDNDAEDGFRTCGYAYDLVLAGGVKDASCQDIQNWMLYESFCCSRALEPTAAPTIDTETPRAADGRKCWLDSHSYGVEEHGACDDADILLVYTTSSTIEIGNTQGWWEGGIQAISNDRDDNSSFSTLDCYTACIENENCGGWEFKRESCVLKGKLNCTPSLGYDASSPSSIAGISGCVDATSDNVDERAALDTTNFWFEDCDRPRCTEPVTEGRLVGDTLVPEEGYCWYKQYTPSELYDDCTRNRWIVISGGSNVLAFFSQMVNLFAPVQNSGSPKPLVDFDELFAYSVIDLVLEGGALPILDRRSKSILHLNMKRFCEIDASLPCSTSSLDFHGGTADWPSPYLKALENVLAEAPYSAGATRLTLVVGQIWNNAEAALKAIGGEGTANGWGKSKVVFYGQAMIWYPCNVENWCELPELGSSNEEMYQKYRSDLTRLMDVGMTTCATERFDCFFATHAYGGSLGTRAREMIRILKETTSAYEWAHFIDYNKFVLPGEVVDGHVTPSMFVPVQSMLWNTVCDGPLTGCPEAVLHTPTCSADCFEKGGGSSCQFCGEHDWTCVNERQCDYKTLDPVPWEIAVLAPLAVDTTPGVQCFDSQQYSAYVASINDISFGGQTQDTYHNRIWCSSSAAGWGIGFAFLSSGIMAIFAGFYLTRQKNRHCTDMERKEIAVNEVEEQSGPEDFTAEPVSTVIKTKSNIIEKEGSDLETQDQSPLSTSHTNVDAATGNRSPYPNEKGQKTEYLNSLGLARLLASQHIVLGHLYAKGATANVYFYSWGYTWVPWFFVLSGYVLTHARLNSSRPTNADGPYKHIAQRLSTIFPMYALGVLLSMIIRIARDVRLPGVDVLIGQSFLLQSWVPQWTEEALLSQCWFLSGMLVYWGLFRWIYKWMRLLTLKWTLALLVFVCFLPWLTIIVPVLDDDIETNWYNGHRFGEMDTSTDLWTVMLKFHPVFYFHVFVFGMLLAVLRQHLKDDNHESPLRMVLTRLTQFGAMVGYLGLILVFTIDELQPTSYKLSARLSVLLPLQGAMLLGLSPLPQVVETGGFRDPLAILFSYAPTWIGDVSYCQYVLQFAMYDLFPQRYIDNPSFFLYLWGASLLAYKLVQEPGAKLWRRTLAMNQQEEEAPTRFLPSRTIAGILFIPPIALAAILGIAKGTHIPGHRRAVVAPLTQAANRTNYTILPPFVRYAPEVVDLKLNWTLDNSTFGDIERAPINPSILFLGSEGGRHVWVRAVRAHAVQEATASGSYQGNNVTEQILHFQSSIMIRSEQFVGNLSAGFDDEGIAQWGLDGTNLLASTKSTLMSHMGKDTTWADLCEPQPSYDAINSMLSRKVVNGPEDPKLFQTPSYSSTNTESSNGSWGIAFSSFPPAAILSESSLQDDCQWDDRAVMQMYVVSAGASLAVGDKAVGVRLAYGDTMGPEKNWIAFHHESTQYFIYSVEPHVVVQVRSTDGAAAERYQTSSPHLQELTRSHGYTIRGSATALRYSETEYLGLFHTYSQTTGGYSTAAYTFSAKPPFAVLRISKPLPLQGHSFASSLALESDKVIVGYGEADQSSRVLVFSRRYLEEQLLDWCSS